MKPIKGKRFRKTFKTKGEAQRFEASCWAKVVENPDWSPRPKDCRTLAELVGLWFDLHGHSLRDGERHRSKLDALAKRLRNPQGAKLDPQTYAQDRRIRLGEGASPKTLATSWATSVRSITNCVVWVCSTTPTRLPW